jgi:glutathione S-transferase
MQRAWCMSDSHTERRAKLYVISGSHACRSAMLMLDHKHIAYDCVRLITGTHPFSVRLRGFPGNELPIRHVEGSTYPRLAMMDRAGTVPALRIGKERIQTNHAIARFLESRQPDPPLLPADRELREQVQEAELWGDRELQMAARRIALAASAGGLEQFHARAAAGRLGPLLAHSDQVRVFASRGARSLFKASIAEEPEMLASLPGMLDRIDAWIAAGVLGGQELNVADFMIVPSLALIAYRRDLRPSIEDRPAGALLRRVLPEPPT